jgi:crossover junction endodeoxyribonuclease RuvC
MVTVATCPTVDANPFVRPELKLVPANPRTLLALDLGATTGWALKRIGRPLVSGTMTFKANRFEGGGMPFVRFRRWLAEVEAAEGPLAVFFEEVRAHAGTTAAHAYGGFLAELSAWCEKRAHPYEGVPVATIKRFAVGRGNADKLAVIDAIRARGFWPADHNEADAIAILLWAIQTRGSAS